MPANSRSQHHLEVPLGPGGPWSMAQCTGEGLEAKIQPTPLQLEACIGSLLGDGSIHNEKKMFGIEQAQAGIAYVMWLHWMLAGLASKVGEVVPQRKHLPNGPKTFSCRFSTSRAFACTEVLQSIPLLPSTKLVRGKGPRQLPRTSLTCLLRLF